MTFYVYKLSDPRNGLPFYIGKGKGLRAWSHTKLVRAGRPTGNAAKDDMIADILSDGLEPEIDIIASFSDEKQAFALEIDLIGSTLGLLNIRRGGEGWAMSEEEAARRAQLRLDKAKADEHAKAMIKMRKWLKMVDSFPNGVTFPGLKDGDRMATELVEFIRDMVAKEPIPNF